MAAPLHVFIPSVKGNLNDPTSKIEGMFAQFDIGVSDTNYFFICLK